MSSPYDELAAGRPGPLFSALLYDLVRHVARAGNFPAPDGHAVWDETAVFTVAHDFWAAGRGERRLAAIAVAATDDASLRHVLQAAVLNALRDRARATDLGALVLRVGEVLERSGETVQAPPGPTGRRWQAVGGAPEPSTADAGLLAAAASRETDVVIPRWTSDRRRPPVADFGTIERIVVRVLGAAAGSLTATEIAGAVAARVDVTRVPLVVALDVLERLPAEGRDSGQPESVLSRIRATELFAGTSDREKVLLAVWEMPLRSVRSLVGVGPSQASDGKQRLASALREALADDDDPDAVVESLMTRHTRTTRTTLPRRPGPVRSTRRAHRTTVRWRDRPGLVGDGPGPGPARDDRAGPGGVRLVPRRPGDARRCSRTRRDRRRPGLPGRSLAWLLHEQWPIVVAANAGDGRFPDGSLMEIDQAEPWTVYVPTEQGALVVLDGAAVPPSGCDTGPLAFVATRPQPVGAVVLLMSGPDDQAFLDSGTLHVTDPTSRPGWWVRLPHPPAVRDAAGLWSAAEAVDPLIGTRGWGPAPERGPVTSRRETGQGRQMQLVLLCVPEETARRATGEGWIAVARYRSEPKKPPGAPRAFRVSRAGRDDLHRRAPELAALRGKTVVVVGTGGLGAAITQELSKLALAGLVLVDPDVVDPATAVRFGGAFRFAGLPKVAALGQLAIETQPYTRVATHQWQLGRPGTPGDPNTSAVIRGVVAGADLVVDATAHLGAQQFLSDVARDLGVGYLQAEATDGVWGGLVALYPPGPGPCWVCVQHHLVDGTIPALPHTTAAKVQPPGCLEPTYSGTGFDLVVIAAQAVRQAVSYLTGGSPGGYGPPADGVLTVVLRDETGAPVLPAWRTHVPGRNPACDNHR